MAVDLSFLRSLGPRSVARVSCLGALSCLLLTSCVGEVRKSTIGPDAEAQEPPDVTDAGVPGTGGERPDATMAQGDSARPPPVDASIADARVVPPGTADTGVLPQDARAPVDTGIPDAQVSTPDTGTPSSSAKGVFVAVGYKGVRMRSIDGGKTWTDVVQSGGGGDDQNLLRTVSFGGGMFVAVGWKIWSSTDGASWTERDNPAKQWMGGVEYGNNLFVGAGGSGTSIYSMDGTQWMSGKDRSGEPARTVAFGNGTFVAGTDPNNWWSTTNGMTWTVMAGGKNSQVMWCGNRFSVPSECTEPLAHANGRTAFGNNVYVSAAGDKIERSEDGGKTWTTVKDTKDAPVEDVVFGMVTLP